MNAPSHTFGTELLRDAMRHVPGTVSVITAGVGSERTGLTASSVTSLSLTPPTMLATVNRSASAWPIIQRHRHFCINVLASHHRHVAEKFAGRDGVKGVHRYADAGWVELATGASALADAVVAIDCELEEAIERHSHAIVLGAVKAVRINGGPGLAYGHGRFGIFQSEPGTQEA